MARPIALLTDFGPRDAYVGILKGVLLTRAPAAPLLDLSHAVPPYDIRAGALLLESALPYLPHNCIVLGVVDPGVGGQRRPIALRSADRLLIGPDNGLLWPAAALEQHPEAFELTCREFWLPQVSSTFHGRDVFAPVAAAAALGADPEALGVPIVDPVQLAFPAPVPTVAGWQGEVLHTDHFGNAITSLRPSDLGFPDPGTLRFQGDGWGVVGPVATYEAVPKGSALALLGSLGRYEIALREGNAAERLGLHPGAPVRVERAG